MEKENQRVVLTKRLLKDSLLELMKTKSIQNVSVKELCDVSGINRSTFYNHYDSPNELLGEIEDKAIEDMNRIWMTKSNIPVNKRVEHICLYIRENSDLFKLLLRDSDASSDFPIKLMKTTCEQLDSDHVLINVKDKQEIELLKTFLANGAYYMIRQWMLDEVDKSPKEIGELFQKIVSSGIIRK